MADELDLERGDPDRAEERRTRRRSTRSKPVEGESQTLSEKLDREVHTRLVESLERIQEWRESRDDMELADAIGEDKDKMAKGVVSVTHVFTPLRGPLVIFLGFIEPVLAFGRVGRILIGRWFERRQRQAEELANQQAEWDANHQPAAQAESIFK